MLDPNPEANQGAQNQSENEAIKTYIQTIQAQQVIDEFNEVKEDARQLKEQTDRIETRNHSVSIHGELPDGVKEGNKQQKLDTIVKKVKQTLVAIHEKAEVLELINNEQSREVLFKLCEKKYPLDNVVHKINENNALYICELIGRGLDGRLNSTSDFIEAFASIKNLEYLDNNLIYEISNVFQEHAQELGAAPQELENLKSLKHKKDEEKVPSVKEQIKSKYTEISKETKKINQSVSRLIDGLIDERRIKNSEKGKKIRIQCKNDNEFEARISQEVMDIKSELQYLVASLVGEERPIITENMTAEEYREEIIRVNQSNSKITDDDLENNFKNLIEYINDLRNQDLISVEGSQRIRTETSHLKNKNKELLQIRDRMQLGNGRSLVQYAENYIQNLGDDQKTLLEKLGDKDAFLEYAKVKYKGFETKKNWDDFRADIRGLYDTIFSATASNPKDFWERSFNELTEGIVYKMLNGALIMLGENIRGDVAFGKDSNLKVGVRDYYAQKEAPRYEKSLLSGGPTLTKEKIIKVDLGRAMVYLTHEMIDYKELSQYGHDINVLCDLGLGFEKLAELSGRLRMEDVTRLIKSMPGLSDAMQLYHANLLLIPALNNKSIPVDFGRQGLHHLDSVGIKTYIELKSLHSMAGYMKNKSNEDRENDIRRLIRLASGISKGVTGAYWGAISGNVISVEYESQQGEIGEKVDKRDKRIFSKIIDTFKSLSERGIEKMSTSIDPYLNLRRFQNPRLIAEYDGAFAPRELKGFKPSATERMTNHADIIKWHKKLERARGNGRDNELIDQDKVNIFFYETLRTTAEDLAIREGWRHFDYRRYLVYETGENSINKSNQQKKLDFYKTIRRLEGVCPQLIKIFVNDLSEGKFSFNPEIKGLSFEDVGKQLILDNRRILEGAASSGWDPENPKKSKLNEKQKEILKIFLYEKYIYDQIQRTSPSQFILMEERRWMNEDEVRGKLLNETDVDGNYKYTEGLTFHDRLTSYLVKKYGNKHTVSWIETNLLPMYISAVQVVEKNEWDERFEKWEKAELSGDYGNNSFFNYTLGTDAFDKEKNRNSLEILYKEYRENIGSVQEDKKISFLKDEDFIDNLKGFFTEIKTVIGADRQELNQIQDSSGRWYNPSANETLIHRYAKMLACKGGAMGGIDKYLTWNLMNMNEFYFETSGNRMHERMFSELAVLVKGMIPEVGTIISYKLDAFTRKVVEDIHQLEASIKEHFGEHFQKINSAIANIDADQGWIYCGRLMMSLEKLAVKDKIFRIGVVGPIIAGLYQRLTGNAGQQSYLTSKIPVTESEGATSLDSTGAFVFFRVLGDLIGMPREEHQVVGYEPPKLFGKEVKGKLARIIKGKPITKHNSVSIADLIVGADVQTSKRILEQLPMIGPIFLILMGLLLKLALDKDKKK